jgi:hypothetical protein
VYTCPYKQINVITQEKYLILDIIDKIQDPEIKRVSL